MFDTNRYGDRFSMAEAESILNAAIGRLHADGYRFTERPTKSEWVDYVFQVHTVVNQMAAGMANLKVVGREMGYDEAIDYALETVKALMVKG